MDDDEEIRQTTGDVLKRLGYMVEFAGDGSRTIDLYREAREAGTPFDAVIMDLTIPGGMGGDEALKRLQTIDPNIRAILSSGHMNNPIVIEYRKYGFSGLVPKPYRIDDLGEIVHAVIQDRISGAPDRLHSE